jgi:hypothetical protein
MEVLPIYLPSPTSTGRPAERERAAASFYESQLQPKKKKRPRSSGLRFQLTLLSTSWAKEREKGVKGKVYHAVSGHHDC